MKKNASKLTSYVFDFGEDGFMLEEDPKAEQDESRKGLTSADQSLLGDKNQFMLLLPQDLEKASLYVEVEYTVDDIAFTVKQSVDLKGEWKPGVTVTYTLNSKVPELPLADLCLMDENDMPLKEIKVGYAGGETNYKVLSYLNYRDANGVIFKRLPMPWKASIVKLDKNKLDENGNPTETAIMEFKFGSDSYGVASLKDTIKNQVAFEKEFGSVKRIEFDCYSNNIPASLDAMEGDPVKTLVMIPKIIMKKTSSLTAYMQGQGELYSKEAPFNLASRGIGLAENGLDIFHKNGKKDPNDPNNNVDEWTDHLRREYKYTDDNYGDQDINTANCYIVSAPGWYTIPLVYGNAVKDGCVNYGAFVFKSNYRGVNSSTVSESLNGKNKILINAINHAGNPIQSPYILDGNGIDDYTNLEAKLLWEDQICLIEDISLEDASGQSLFRFYYRPPTQYSDPLPFSPHKKIRFHISKDNIRQGNAVIVLKEKDTEDKKSDIIWSWHIWVTPDGTGHASNYHPISHLSTIYGRLLVNDDNSQKPEDRIKWTEKHNHYIYNRCIGMVLAGDELSFTPPDVYIKYEPLYEAMTNLLINPSSRYVKDYGFIKMMPQAAKAYVNKMRDYFKNNPVYVKVSQDELNCKVEEDYYMLYQWGRKDPMFSRFEHIYDDNHCLINPTDKRYMREHGEITDHKEWIKYGIKHPGEFMSDGHFSNGTYYANLWNFSLGTDEINAIYPAYSNKTDFINGDAWMGASKYILTDFYIPSDRVFKSVYDPSPVGQKMPVGTVLNFLSTNTNNVTADAGDNGTWYYYNFAPLTSYGHSDAGMGGLFIECKKGADGKYTTAPDYSSPHTFWIPAFGYRFGDGFTKKHGTDFAIWEGGPLTSEGRGHVLYGNSDHVTSEGANRPFVFTMGLPVLPIFEEPQWIRTF